MLNLAYTLGWGCFLASLMTPWITAQVTIPWGCEVGTYYVDVAPLYASRLYNGTTFLGRLSWPAATYYGCLDLGVVCHVPWSDLAVLFLCSYASFALTDVRHISTKTHVLAAMNFTLFAWYVDAWGATVIQPLVSDGMMLPVLAGPGCGTPVGHIQVSGNLTGMGYGIGSSLGFLSFAFYLTATLTYVYSV